MSRLRREKLLAFIDLPFVSVDGGVFCQDAFWLFLACLGARFERLVVLGRVQSRLESPRHRCTPGDTVEFQPLPAFSTLYAPGEVLRGIPRLVLQAWGPVGRCDALLLAAPHPWSLVLWCVGRLRGKQIAFLARSDLLEVVRYRASARWRRGVMFGARALEAVFRRLSRTTLTFAVGEQIAGRYRAAPHAPVHAILISLVPAAALGARARRAPSERPPRLLWVGRIAAEKRPDLLLAAFRELVERRGGPLELDVVGEGPLLGELQALATRLGVAERVRFRGYVSQRGELDALYAEADALVHASACEGFPQVILEAMANELPVVATKAGGIPLLLRDGENAVLVPCNDASALARGIERVLDTPELRRRLVLGGGEFVREHTLELEVERLAKLWDAHFDAPRPA